MAVTSGRAPFHHRLSVVFTFALFVCLVAAAASWLRGGTAPRAAAADAEPSAEPSAEPDAVLALNPAMILQEDS